MYVCKCVFWFLVDVLCCLMFFFQSLQVYTCTPQKKRSNMDVDDWCLCISHANLHLLL